MGGYENLLVYRRAVAIYDLTEMFLSNVFAGFEL